jgi:uncharacterized protein YjbI with pentapeptide repeats
VANQKHLDILNQGVVEWNQWRKEHPEIEPDLSHVVFIRANLKEANLSEAILHRATFTDEAPIGADLLEGDGLITSELYEADFGNTQLSNAHYFQTNLHRVNLRTYPNRECDIRVSGHSLSA